MRKLRNFLAACVLAGSMVAVPTPAQADDDCFGICIITNDWWFCVWVCG